MIKINKPKFWDRKIGLISILFFPLTLIVIFFTFLKKKITKTRGFKIPVICVGNIYLGGTGKTPTSILLANELSKLGKKPLILRKYYKNHNDEYSLIKNYFKNLIISKNRIEGLKEAEKSNFDIVILDDGLQDYKIKKNLSIVCFNNNQLIGNGMVLPSGPLRENLSILKNVEIVIINGNKNINFENKILNINKKLEIFYSFYKPINLDQFKNKKLLALAAIGNPENFFQLVEKNNLKIFKKKIFPDHYQFSKAEMQNILREAEMENYQVIMTEKDYYKINHYKLKKINYLRVSLEIYNKEKLFKKINSLYV
jgi:tetraacyldisaccharide 4'-kinase